MEAFLWACLILGAPDEVQELIEYKNSVRVSIAIDSFANNGQTVNIRIVTRVSSGFWKLWDPHFVTKAAQDCLTLVCVDGNDAKITLPILDPSEKIGATAMKLGAGTGVGTCLSYDISSIPNGGRLQCRVMTTYFRERNMREEQYLVSNEIQIVPLKNRDIRKTCLERTEGIQVAISCSEEKCIVGEKLPIEVIIANRGRSVSSDNLFLNWSCGRAAQVVVTAPEGEYVGFETQSLLKLPTSDMPTQGCILSTTQVQVGGSIGDALSSRVFGRGKY